MAVLAGFLLVGCTAQQQPAELEREQSPGDALPASAAVAEQTVDAETSRFVGEAEGYDIYIGRQADSDNTCVIFVEASTDDWQSTTCGGSGVGTDFPSGTGVEVGSLGSRMPGIARN